MKNIENLIFIFKFYQAVVDVLLEVVLEDLGVEIERAAEQSTRRDVNRHLIVDRHALDLVEFEPRQAARVVLLKICNRDGELVLVERRLQHPVALRLSLLLALEEPIFVELWLNSGRELFNFHMDSLVVVGFCCFLAHIYLKNVF